MQQAFNEYGEMCEPPEKVKTVGFYDIETYHGLTSDIAVIGFKERGKEYVPYYSAKEFIEGMKGRYKSIKLYGYNSGKFDILCILESLKREQYPISISNVIFSGSSINTLQIGNLVFKDLILSFGQKFKLAQLAKDFFNESKADFDCADIKEITPEMIKYNEQDLYLTERLYNELERIMGVPISTAASMSMNTYRTFFKTDIETLCPKRGIRDSYKGGRTEIFKFAGKDVSVYDVNSMYPWCLEHYAYPVGELHHEKNINKEGYSFAVVHVPYSYIPYLAMKTSSKLLFPYGTTYGYFTNFELRKAKAMGAEIEVMDSWVADRSEYLFSDYIRHYYNLRLEAKKNKEVSKDLMYKTLMNCLYGKFGQRIIKDITFTMRKDEYECRVAKDKELQEADIILTFMTVDGEKHLLRRKEKSEKMYYDYVIASYVTAYARDKLHWYFSKAGLENIYYCDTDSIFTDADLSNECGSDLGLIKHEKVYKDYRAVAPKMYRGIDESGKSYIKAKGFRRLTNEQFDNIGTYQEKYISVCGFREATRRNKSFFHTIERVRSVQSEYDKRTRLDDIETAPINMDMCVI
jgi:hypothetical protein